MRLIVSWFAPPHAGLAVETAEPEHLFSLRTGGMQQAFLYVCWWRTMTYFKKKIIIHEPRTMNIPDLISKSLEKNFWIKNILNFFVRIRIQELRNIFLVKNI